MSGAEASNRVQPVPKVEAIGQELPKKEPPSKERKDAYAPSSGQPEKDAGVYKPASLRKDESARKNEQAVRTALENLKGKFTVVTDMADVAAFTKKQLEEFEVMAHLQANVRFVFSGMQPGVLSARSEQRIRQLQSELGVNRIVITEGGIENVSLNKGEKLIQISKTGARPTSHVPRKSVFSFRYLGEETGLVPVALLYADQHEKPSPKGLMDLSMVGAILRAEIREFQNSIVFARAA